MIKKVILFAIIIPVQIYATMAQVIPNTQDITLESKVLEEQRELKIYLPKDYTENKSYPVLYITDGQTSNFEVAKHFLDVLSDPTFNIIPPCILVGIKQKKRQNELRAFGGNNGEEFMNYLFNEMVPFIDSNYSTSGFNAMIGHSDGAEFNHFLLVSDNNPFQGFVSMSIDFNMDLKDEIAQFFNSYTGNSIYYFIANGTRDITTRIEAGNTFESIVKNAPNNDIKFEKKTYPGDHQSIVALSLLDGLLFIFQDYKNIEKYTSIVDFGENYLNDIMKNYGVTGNYKMGDVELFWDDIFNYKKVEEYQYMTTFFEEHFDFVIDPLNHAINYSYLGLYSEAIKLFNRALEEVAPVQPGFFYMNISKAINNYEVENRLNEAIIFLEKSSEILPEKYMLNMSYHIAKLSLSKKVAVKKGKKSLAYCKANYRKNDVFTMDDLVKLEKK